MKKHLKKEIFKIGHTKVDLLNMKTAEFVMVMVVGMLSLTLGTIYGVQIF